jgi:heterodisulfide reductase subunit C
MIWLGSVAPTAMRCQQCGCCAAVCPSYRHGGIRPAEVMARAMVCSLDPQTEVLWKCARCMSCSERCPSGAEPGEVIARLRERVAEQGGAPAYLMDEAKRFVQTGTCFPRTGMTKKMRRDLDLPEGEVTERAVREIKEIARRTKLGRLVRE